MTDGFLISQIMMRGNALQDGARYHVGMPHLAVRPHYLESIFYNGAILRSSL